MNRKIVKLFIAGAGLSASMFVIACNKERHSEGSTASERMDQTTGTSNTTNEKGRHMHMGNDAGGYMPAMQDMMDRMNSMQRTGIMDVDFAKMMVEHHRGAIAMADKELTKGDDEKVKSMARATMEKQKGEIDEMQAFINKTPLKKGAAKDTVNHMKDAMSKMSQKMDDMKMAGDPDKDFVMMMIHHHESGIDMAKAELAHGDSPEMKQMARQLIDEQTKDIKELKAMNPQ